MSCFCQCLCHENSHLITLKCVATKPLSPQFPRAWLEYHDSIVWMNRYKLACHCQKFIRSVVLIPQQELIADLSLE